MKSIKTLLSSGILLLATALPLQANEQDNKAPQQINFSVQASRQIERDTMQVVLYTQQSGKTLKDTSDSVTQKLNLAVEEAKKRNIQTGMTNRRTHITYDKQGKQDGWTDYAEISLESKDFTALSELIAATSKQLAVQNIRFTLSDEQKQSLEHALTEEALEAFKQKATLISKSLSAKDYRIAQLEISNPNDDRADNQPVYYERKVSLSSLESPNMQVQSGVADLKIQIHASITLITQ